MSKYIIANFPFSSFEAYPEFGLNYTIEVVNYVNLLVNFKSLHL